LTRKIIPPRVREGDFVTRDGRRNPKATTIRIRNYTTR
jgi:hypothetical protein